MPADGSRRGSQWGSHHYRTPFDGGRAIAIAAKVPTRCWFATPSTVAPTTKAEKEAAKDALVAAVEI